MQYRDLAYACLRSAVEDTLGTDPARPLEPDVGSLQIAAVIGFAGRDVRGTLGVAANREGLAQVASHFELGETSPLRDESLGEFANILLGYVKRAFGRRGIHIDVATPLVIRGLAIEVEGRREAVWVECERCDDPSRIVAWIDSEATPELVVPDEAADHGIAERGETLFF